MLNMTTPKNKIHFSDKRGTHICGCRSKYNKPKQVTDNWDEVTCTHCLKLREKFKNRW